MNARRSGGSGRTAVRTAIALTCLCVAAGCARDKAQSWQLPQVTLPKISNPFARPEPASSPETSAGAIPPPPQPDKAVESKPAMKSPPSKPNPPAAEPPSPPPAQRPAPQPPAAEPSKKQIIQAEPPAAAPTAVVAAPRSAAFDYAGQLAVAARFEQVGKPADAKSVYQELISRSPERAEAYHRLGRVIEAEGRLPEAEGLYLQALQLDRQNADVLNDLGYNYCLQNKLPQAEQTLVRAVAIDPRHAYYRNNLGIVQARQGRWAEALEQFRLTSSEADAQYNLAQLRLAVSDRQGAEAALRAALSADPNHQAARNALDTVVPRTGQAADPQQKTSQADRPDARANGRLTLENAVQPGTYEQPAGGSTAAQPVSHQAKIDPAADAEAARQTLLAQARAIYESRRRAMQR